MPDAAIVHLIAHQVARRLVRDCEAQGCSWQETMIALETVITIAVSAATVMQHPASPVPDRLRFAQEMVEAVTEGAHNRIVAYLKGEPYAG